MADGETAPGWLHGWFATALVVLGAVLLQLGVVAGYVNRQVLDADRLAASVDELRRDPDVSAALGRSLTDAFLEQQPDAVAVRPLIDTIAASVVGSDALSGPTRAAVVQMQQALVEPNAQTVVLRIADAGAVLAAVLAQVAPAGTVTADSQIPLELARIGGQSFAGTTIKMARFVRGAAWLLPLAGVLVMALGVAMSARRRRAVAIAGLVLIALAGASALGLLAGAWWAGSHDAATVSGALVSNGWPILMGPAWWSVLAAGLVGLLLVATAASVMPEVDPAAVAAKVVALARRRPRRPAAQVVRAALIIALGVALAVRPMVLLILAGISVCLWLVLVGVRELAVATNDEDLRLTRRSGGTSVPPRRAVGTAGLAAVTAAAVLLVLVLAGTSSTSSPADATTGTAAAVAGAGQVCNGHAELCERRFDEVAYISTHNSMATASDPRWYIPEQTPSIEGQLDDGARSLLVDVWPGYPTTDGRVATARSAYAEAKATLEAELGVETVAAGLRVIDAVSTSTPDGPEALYMCHGLCELGARQLQSSMAAVKTWLDTHPDEVLSIVIEDHAPAAQIGQTIVDSGLSVYATAPPAAGTRWPTLREMITSGKRLYIMLEEGEGGAEFPWLANAFDALVQDTPYTYDSVASLQTCAANRGPSDAPLFLLNHWLSGFGQLVTNARLANAADVLGVRAQACATERQLPNFVAVNYADIGDVRAVVDRLNGVTSP